MSVHCPVALEGVNGGHERAVGVPELGIVLPEPGEPSVVEAEHHAVPLDRFDCRGLDLGEPRRRTIAREPHPVAQATGRLPSNRTICSPKFPDVGSIGCARKSTVGCTRLILSGRFSWSLRTRMNRPGTWRNRSSSSICSAGSKTYPGYQSFVQWLRRTWPSTARGSNERQVVRGGLLAARAWAGLLGGAAWDQGRLSRHVNSWSSMYVLSVIDNPKKA